MADGAAAVFFDVENCTGWVFNTDNIKPSHIKHDQRIPSITAE